MLRGLRGRPATKTTLAAAMLLGISAGTAAAATGGAGLADIDAQRTPTPTQVAPVLAPVASIPQLAAGVAFRRISKRAVSAATLTYVSHARNAQRVRVDVVRLADGYSVFTDERTVAPEAPQRIAWNGRARSGLAL